MIESPAHWHPLKLGEVAEFKYGKALPATVRDGGKYPVFGSNGVVGQHSDWLSPAPTIVIGRKGSVGEVCLSEKNCSPIDTTYYVDSFDFFDPKFCYYLLKNLRLGELNKSTAIPGLNRQDAYKLEIRLPPIAEQIRIAQKLDELLDQVDILKTRMDVVRSLLKTFRQSVLVAAVSGRLTEEWRISRCSVKDEPISLKLSDVAAEIVDCPHSTPKWQLHGKKCVRTTEFSPGFLDVDAAGFVSEATFSERTKRIKPTEGDILYAREGTVGIACPVPPNVEVCMGQRMVLIRASSIIHPRFLLHSLNSEIILSKVRSLVMGSTAPRVNVKDLKNFEIPIPSLEEQTEIVRRVEQLFAFADQLEAKVASAKSRIDHLTQSILAKAFRGELVPQDPNDEPASVLLERIKAQRAAAPKAKRGRKASA